MLAIPQPLPWTTEVRRICLGSLPDQKKHFINPPFTTILSKRPYNVGNTSATSFEWLSYFDSLGKFRFRLPTMRTIICLTPLQPTRANCNILDTFYFKCYFRVSGYPSDHFGEFKEIFSSPNMIHKIFPAHIAFQKLIYLQTTFTGVPDTFPYFPVSEALYVPSTGSWLSWTIQHNGQWLGCLDRPSR